MSMPALARIRQIARGGDTNRAWQAFEDAGLADAQFPDVLALRGRLLKDRALRLEGEARRATLCEAMDFYRRSAGDRRTTYPLINAATLAFLCGNMAEAHAQARVVLDMISSGEHEPETAFWLHATKAEAHLLLGETEACRNALRQAKAEAPTAWEDQAAAARQLREILQAIGDETVLLDELKPPPSLHFSGLIDVGEDEEPVASLLAERIENLRPGCIFGALAAGADIIAAEHAMASGAELHVVLPGTVQEFRAASVTPFGKGWARRFDTLIDAAHSLVEFAEQPGVTQAGIVQATQVAMGLAIRNARSLSSDAVAIHIGRSGETAPSAYAFWQARGLKFDDCMLDFPRTKMTKPLKPARTSVVLVCSEPFVDVAGVDVSVQVRIAGYWLLTFETMIEAIRFAGQTLTAIPLARLGIDLCVVTAGARLENYGLRAICLARAAKQDEICGPWPQMAALELLDASVRFEMSGDLVTPFGDLPISRFRAP